jgi:hypothetical protein
MYDDYGMSNSNPHWGFRVAEEHTIVTVFCFSDLKPPSQK